MDQENASSIISGIAGFRRVHLTDRKIRFSDPDDFIIDKVNNGDPEAFGTLVRRYEDFVFTLISGIVNSPDTAKDVSQEVFLRVYKSIRRFEKRSHFKTWLYKIAYNTALAHLEREKRIVARENSADFKTVDNSYHDYTDKLLLEKIIRMLKPEYRAVIILHYYEDLKYEEIAEVLECPVGTVKIRLYRAKYELKQLWSRHAIRL